MSRSALKDAETARRGFLIDGNPTDLAEFERSAASWSSTRSMTLTEPDQEPTRPVRAMPPARGHRPAPGSTSSGGRSTAPEPGVSSRAGREFAAEPIRAPAADVLRADPGDRRSEELVPGMPGSPSGGPASGGRSCTFSVASTLALILIGSIYALVRRYLAERSKADLTLRESEARVRLLLDSAGEGVYGVDARGTSAPSATPPPSSSWASSRPSRSSAGTCTS